jgi:ABC-type sugar transport system permease subunit/ABC-type glycerol-3-phosphate transport system substrate-binding protein
VKGLPLRAAVALFVLLVSAVSWWTYRSAREPTDDGRENVVLWAGWMLGDDLYAAIDRFEKLHPQYRVTATTGTAKDAVGDSQRLLSAIAGGVPPDVVFFDRFEIGEWASRHALEDLTPYIAAQDPRDPDRIDLDDYYPWTIEEASYRAPGSQLPSRVYGIPNIADVRVLYANLDLLRQEGLTDERGEPKLPTTWGEIRAYAKRLSRYRAPGDTDSGLVRLGFAPNFGDSFLYMFAFEAGGRLLSRDGLHATMDSPPVVRALRFMTDVYDDLGGSEAVNAFQESFQTGALDPFVKGQVAMKIDGNWYLGDTLGDFKPDMNFALAPAPMPEDELAKGRSPVTWASGRALVIPATSRHKQAAFELIRYLRTWNVVAKIDESKRERKENEGRLYLPTIDANRRFTERIFQANVFGNPAMPERFRAAYHSLIELLHSPEIRPVSPVGQLLWRQQIRAYEAAVVHKYVAEARATGEDETEIALRRMQEPVQRQLDELTRPPPPHVVGWAPYFVVYGFAVVVALLAMLVVSHRRRAHGYKLRETGAALLFASPWIVGFVVLTGGPVLFSVVLSFTRYDVLTDARYVGLANYRDVFADPVFYRSLLNTGYMVLRIPLLMAVGLAMALLLNSGVRALAFYRTGLYLPVTMPLVASCLLWVWIFNSRASFLNEALSFCIDTAPARAFEWVVSRFTAQPFRLDVPLWLQDPRFSKLALIIMNVWAAGGGMVIWLAGLQSIPRQLYEAASIDGAGPLRRFWHVTLPMLSPYILFNSIVGLIGTMQIFTEAYIMTSGGPVDSTLFYAYYLFRQAFQFFRMGYASALAWILFIAVLALTVLQLRLSKRWVHYDQT